MLLQPAAVTARLIVSDLDTALNDLRESGLAITPETVALLELARDDLAELRAALDEARIKPAAAPNAVGLDDEMRHAWQAAAAFREALRSGDAEAIKEQTEQLIDLSQRLEHSQARQYCAGVLDDERRKKD